MPLHFASSKSQKRAVVDLFLGADDYLQESLVLTNLLLASCAAISGWGAQRLHHFEQQTEPVILETVLAQDPLIASAIAHLQQGAACCSLQSLHRPASCSAC